RARTRGRQDAARRWRHTGGMVSGSHIDGADAPTGSILRAVERWRDGERRLLDDHVAEEVPVAFVYNDAPFAVMMATPADLADFALGFAVSEGIVDDPADVAVERVEHLLEGIEVRVRIPQARADALERRRRS